MSHIPKRACQNGIFLSEPEAPLVDLKPGQKELAKSDFFTVASAAYPRPEPYFSENQFWGSVYKQTTGVMDVEDYKQSLRDRVRGPRSSGSSKVSDLGKLHVNPMFTAKHWESDYQRGYVRMAGANKEFAKTSKENAFGDGMAAHQRVAPASCVTEDTGLSTFNADFGFYGSNPRDKMKPGDTALPIIKNVLTEAYEKGETTRTPARTLLTETYHYVAPGYTGYRPVDAKNDPGPPQISSRTTTGRDYALRDWNL